MLRCGSEVENEGAAAAAWEGAHVLNNKILLQIVVASINIFEKYFVNPSSMTNIAYTNQLTTFLIKYI
jgi:hypothetical protein